MCSKQSIYCTSSISPCHLWHSQNSPQTELAGFSPSRIQETTPFFSFSPVSPTCFSHQGERCAEHIDFSAKNCICGQFVDCFTQGISKRACKSVPRWEQRKYTFQGIRHKSRLGQRTELQTGRPNPGNRGGSNTCHELHEEQGGGASACWCGYMYRCVCRGACSGTFHVKRLSVT